MTFKGFSIRSLESLSPARVASGLWVPNSFFCWGELGWCIFHIRYPLSGSTISTLLNGKINPKDWQVLSLGAGFLQFFRVFQVIMANPACFLIIWDYESLLEMGAAVSWKNQDKMLEFLSVCCLNSELWRTHCDQAGANKVFFPMTVWDFCLRSALEGLFLILFGITPVLQKFVSWIYLWIADYYHLIKGDSTSNTGNTPGGVGGHQVLLGLAWSPSFTKVCAIYPGAKVA